MEAAWARRASWLDHMPTGSAPGLQSGIIMIEAMYRAGWIIVGDLADPRTLIKPATGAARAARLISAPFRHPRCTDAIVRNPRR